MRMYRTPCVVEAIESRLLMAKSLGIDVSHWQGSINWTSVRNAGKDFVIMKATESVNYTDPTFTTNYNGARNAGLKVSFYHFARPLNNTAVAEANYFLGVTSARIVPGNLPPVLDLESGGGSLSVAALTQWANDFCNTVYNATGVRPMIYTSTNYATNYLDKTVAQWPLWIANWPTNPNPETGNPSVGDASNGWPASSWKIWQYSSTGSVSGISGNVDLDVFNGDINALNSFLITAQEVGVSTGGTNLTSGQGTAVNFGDFVQNAPPPSKVFTVTNSGGMKLNLGAVTVPSGFSLAEPLVSSLVPGASDTFTITMNTATLGTRSGNISFTTNDADENPFAFLITGSVTSPDSIPPTVVSSSFNHLVSPHAVKFRFSENVSASLSLSDFHFQNLTGGFQVFPSSYSYDAASNTATVGFSGALADANYRATILSAGVFDAASNALAADYVHDFYTLAGDANRDRAVDITDLGILASNWQGIGKLFSQGDFNYDTVVDISDLGMLASNWQKTLPAPSSPSLSAISTHDPATPPIGQAPGQKTSPRLRGRPAEAVLV